MKGTNKKLLASCISEKVNNREIPRSIYLGYFPQYKLSIIADHTCISYI